MSTQVAKPVSVWPLQHRQASSFHRSSSLFRGIVIAKSSCCRRSRPPCKPLGTTKGMSDADTEGSTTTCRSEEGCRKLSITSTESNGRPHIAVHTTSVEDNDDVDFSTNLTIPYLLSVSGVDSVTTTDVGTDYTSEGGDSSHEIDVCSATPVVMAALVKQLEDYLSDEGLANDLFLLKHVKRHRDGYVSLKLLSGYKKVKKLSRNWRVLSLALRNSLLLQLNDDGTKVRRRNPLPSSLLYDAPASRTLVAVNVPSEHASMAGLASLFGTFGGVASLQMVRPKPGGGVPPELQALLVRLPEIAICTSAIIEYEDVWGAAKALSDLVKPPMTLHVLRKTRRSEKSSGVSSRNSPTLTPSPKGRRFSKCEYGVAPDELRSRLRGNRSRQRNPQRESSASDGEDCANSNMSWRTGSPRNLTPQLPRHHYRRHMGSSMSTPSSHTLFHKEQQQQQQHFMVLRAPRGPDGTKGFSRGHS